MQPGGFGFLKATRRYRGVLNSGHSAIISTSKARLASELMDCSPESLVDSTGDYLKRVLLVLDNEAIGPTVRQELADSGYDVHWARSLDEANAMWQPNVFDVVLLDVRHDGERSRAFINRIRAAAPAQRVHFLHRRGRVA